MKLIKLTKGQFAMVDDYDYLWLRKIKWHTCKAKNTYYAVTSNPRIKMHRVILGLGNRKLLVDHKDLNGLNNQRSNLRIANTQQNTYNSPSHKDSSSKFKGVSWDKSRQKWKARIGKKYLGMFKIEADAAIAYNNAAKELHKEFAYLNPIVG